MNQVTTNSGVKSIPLYHHIPTSDESSFRLLTMVITTMPTVLLHSILLNSKHAITLLSLNLNLNLNNKTHIILSKVQCTSVSAVSTVQCNTYDC
jgi:hypothetical protein